MIRYLGLLWTFVMISGQVRRFLSHFSFLQMFHLSIVFDESLLLFLTQHYCQCMCWLGPTEWWHLCIEIICNHLDGPIICLDMFNSSMCSRWLKTLFSIIGWCHTKAVESFRFLFDVTEVVRMLSTVTTSSVLSSLKDMPDWRAQNVGLQEQRAFLRLIFCHM